MQAPSGTVNQVWCINIKLILKNLIPQMCPDLQKPGTIPQTNIFNIKHYKTWYKKYVL